MKIKSKDTAILSVQNHWIIQDSGESDVGCIRISLKILKQRSPNTSKTTTFSLTTRQFSPLHHSSYKTMQQEIENLKDPILAYLCTLRLPQYYSLSFIISTLAFCPNSNSSCGPSLLYSQLINPNNKPSMQKRIEIHQTENKGSRVQPYCYSLFQSNITLLHPISHSPSQAKRCLTQSQLVLIFVH